MIDPGFSGYSRQCLLRLHCLSYALHRVGVFVREIKENNHRPTAIDSLSMHRWFAVAFRLRYLVQRGAPKSRIQCVELN